MFIKNKKHREAAEFLIKYKSKITLKFRKKFLLFYQKLDKCIAKEYFITVSFCEKEYQKYHDILKSLIPYNNKNIFSIYSKITELAKIHNNSYAMIELGKLKKNGKFIFRDLKKVVQFFAFAAKKKCPQGYYYLGKEFFYGRILDQNFDEAKKLFMLALKDNGEPRAGYYLHKILGTCNDEVLNYLKISAIFGYKRALYKYGKLLYNGDGKKIESDKPKGIKLLLQSVYQGYDKATRFCKSNGIRVICNIKNLNFVKLENETRIIANDKPSLYELSSLIESINNESDDVNNNKIIDEKNINKVPLIESSKYKKSSVLIHTKKTPVSNSNKDGEE